MSENLNRVWQSFEKGRREDLFHRFPGFYRAFVVETNDPLQWYRVRFKCPELHDYDLNPEDCPWADKAPWLGGKNTGSWAHPCIGDWVWITFEKQHPYGPIWVGFATPTRRQFYPLHANYTKSPVPVDEDEDPVKNPKEDFLDEYNPLDGRPMSHGWQDRYGNLELNSSVGFNPVEHAEIPASLGQDAVSKSEWDARGQEPEVNSPDRKLMARVTKYGVMVAQSDVGYYWQRKDDASGKEAQLGEFWGDWEKDQEFEIERYTSYTKLLNENEPSNGDQRRYEIRTRAGHKFEMRDVGYAQWAGSVHGNQVQSEGETFLARDDGYGERILSKYSEGDQRWVKWRTKGGHIVQMMDAGFHPSEDTFYKRALLEEVGVEGDGEEEDEWTKRDARQIRVLTRWGTKFVLDDRGTDEREADEKEKPRANGWLLKGRRSWTNDQSIQRGFAFEANEKDELSTTRWYTPKSKIIELNDKKDYMMICTDMSKEISREWQGLKENEFALGIGMTYEPEVDTYHLKLDKANGYLRLKTAGGRDNSRRTEPESFPNVPEEIENQGLEARDGRVGEDGAWTELLDGEFRGLWFSKKFNLGIWRAKRDSDQYILINDGNDNDGRSIIIHNNAGGPMQIFCAGPVEIIAEKDIALKSGGKISFKAKDSIEMEAADGAAHARLRAGAWDMDVPDNAPRHTGFLPEAMPGFGAQRASGGPSEPLDPRPIIQIKREPSDRAVVENGPFDEISEKIITGEE